MTQKIQPSYPKTSTNLNLKVDGIFAYPDEWKTTDEANPNMFTYIIKFANMEITGGKIYPRQLTDKQLRQQQQSKKKGGKKQAKKQENPAQAERLKQILEKQEAEQRRKQQLLSKMNDQQKFYFASEDKHKSALLKFQKNTVQKAFQQNLFVILQQHIIKDKGQWIYVFKVPTANQQQLAKLKKSKPKNLNLNDLNPIVMRAWVDLSSLNSTQVKQISVRTKLKQVDATEQTPKPNLQKTYIKLSISLGQPLQTKQDQYTAQNIIKDPPKPKSIPPQVKYVQQMKQQLRLALQSLAMQYSNMFWKDLNANQEQKSSQIFVSNKKNEHVKRKQQFLYDFNVSGKYKVLKQRLKRNIVHLCESKFHNKMQGAKSFTGITCSVRDQFYSEIYNFLVASYSETMNQLVEQKKQKLKQVFVLNQNNQSSMSEALLQDYKKQSKQQRFSRVVKQYNIVGNYDYGQQMYKKAILKEPENFKLKYQYSLFCIKNGLNTANEVLSWGYIEQYLQRNKQDKDLMVQYILLMIGSEQSKSLKKCWVLLRQLIKQDPKNIQLLLYASLLSQILGKNQNAVNLSSKAYREQLRKLGTIKEQGKHQQNPLASEIPSLSSLATYNIALKPQQKDIIWARIIQKFSELGLYNIIQKIKPKISGENNPTIKKQNIKILYFQQQYNQCKQKSAQLYQESKDYQLLQIIIKCCQKLKQDEQRQKYLKIAIKVCPQQKKSQVLLNLGYFYLSSHKYGNSKACLVKYLDNNQEAGGLSWQILGISELKSNNYDKANECFRHSNLCDPYNNQIWIWFAQSYAKLNNFVMVNQCLNCYLDHISQSQQQKRKLKQLKQNIQRAQSTNFYQSSMKQKLMKRLETY